MKETLGTVSSRKGEGALPAEPAAVARAVLERSSFKPVLGLVLGSGFQHLAERVTAVLQEPYTAIAGFPKPGVRGHEGRLVLGNLAGVAVAVLSGRAHYYEGHSLAATTFPVRVLASMGVRDLLLTCAAGGVNRWLRPGDFLSFSDHINLIGTNPLRGQPVLGLPRFVDLTEAYDPGLAKLLKKSAAQCKIRLRPGVYLAVSGPSYETPAEIRAFERLGADAVGMSTVPEVIVSRQCGLRVAALACITNLAAGRSKGKISHAEVLATGEAVKEKAVRLIETFVQSYGQSA